MVKRAGTLWMKRRCDWRSCTPYQHPRDSLKGHNYNDDWRDLRGWEREKERARARERETDRQTYIQTDRQTDRRSSKENSRGRSRSIRSLSGVKEKEDETGITMSRSTSRGLHCAGSRTIDR